jgi:prolyl-tRNA editing enzyme YbaK/EbsC (Cys-tRNA(Pro) deacylase)
VSPVDRVVAALREAGVDTEVRRFDEPVPTAAAAAEALGCALVLASGAHRVDTRKVAALVGGRRVRRATPDLVLAATGQEVGGVAPTGHPAPLRALVDVDLARHPLLWAGGGDHHTMVALSYADLLRLTGGDEAVVA